MNHEYLDYLDEFLNNLGWKKGKCLHCDSVFFTKNKVEDKKFCDRGNGCANHYDWPKKYKYHDIKDVFCKIRGFFLKNDFFIHPSLNVRDVVTTDFTVAGIQILEKKLHKNIEYRNPYRTYVSQPSVRMKFLGDSNDFDLGTSFVNIATVLNETNIEDHMSVFDLWLSVLSTLGIHMNDVTLKVRLKHQEWGQIKFESLEIFIIYRGVELGDASFALLPLDNGNEYALSDIGFGLEMIVKVLNNNIRYFNMIRPYFVVKTDNNFHDAIKTITLLSMNGVKSSNKHYKILSKKLYTLYLNNNFEKIIKYYFIYWKDFVNDYVKLDIVTKQIISELERMLIFDIYKKISAKCVVQKPKQNDTFDSYLKKIEKQIDKGVIFDILYLYE